MFDKNDTPSYEWAKWYKQEFGILIRSWCRKGVPNITFDEWCWTVYVLIPDTHRLYDDALAKDVLEFHGGVTFCQYITHFDAFLSGKESTVLKIGCDYQHYGDEYFSECDPKDGIPYKIIHDVEILVKQMKGEEVDCGD